jgi:hypothetical protein
VSAALFSQSFCQGPGAIDWFESSNSRQFERTLDYERLDFFAAFFRGFSLL